jgi:soluble lytic murein transglycosylase-like protein
MLLSSVSCLSNDLSKYADIALSIEQLERIASYDRFVRYYCDNLMLYGEENKVDPNFIRALILAESNVQKDAVSADQAYGLTQITPETGSEALNEIEKARNKFEQGEEVKKYSLAGEDLLDPNLNIFIATYLISKYNAKYNGRLDLVVSAWNAGPGSIKNEMPPDYKETLDIIGKINGYYHLLLKLKQQGLSFLQD